MDRKNAPRSAGDRDMRFGIDLVIRPHDKGDTRRDLGRARRADH